MPELDLGIAREAAGEVGLIAGKSGRIGDARRARQLGDQPLGDFVGMLQRIVPAFQRCRAKAAHRLPLPSGQALQREQRVAVELDAIIGGVEGFERDPLVARQPRHVPSQADRGVDAALAERGDGLSGVERDRSPVGAHRAVELGGGGDPSEREQLRFLLPSRDPHERADLGEAQLAAHSPSPPAAR